MNWSSVNFESQECYKIVSARTSSIFSAVPPFIKVRGQILRKFCERDKSQRIPCCLSKLIPYVSVLNFSQDVESQFP